MCFQLHSVPVASEYYINGNPQRERFKFVILPGGYQHSSSIPYSTHLIDRGLISSCVHLAPKMPKSLGGTAQLRANGTSSSLVHITSIASHSDSSVPLASVFSPATWHPEYSSPSQDQSRQQENHAPRPRPSLQVYYTAPGADDPTHLQSAARALETTILAGRHEGRDPAECDRLDVYGFPFPGLEGDMVAACIEHQRREFFSRLRDKDWYLQRYDVGGGRWQRALLVVRERQEEWWAGKEGEDASTRRQIGLSVIFFDPINQGETGATEGGDVWERKAHSVEEEEVLIRELKAELNWQHSASQFED